MIKFAIVGCGHIAKKHVEAIQRVEKAQLVAVCDNHSDRLKQFSEIYGVKGFSTLEDLLDKVKGIDVVNICTPSGLHTEMAIQAAQAKKHVIVEKPLALTVEDADRIIEACRMHHVKLAVVHPNRFRPAVRELKKAIDNGWFGRLSHVNATVRWNRNQAYYDQAPWRGTKSMDGGVLMNQAIHNLDLLLWLCGPVKEVQAYTATRLRNIETEDVAVAILTLENGALGVVEAATTIYPKNLEESISIFGEKGSAIVGGPTANWIQHWSFADVNQEEMDLIVERVNRDPFGISGHEWIIRDMVEAILNDRMPAVTGEDGRAAVALVNAIYKAAEHRCPIRVE